MLMAEDFGVLRFRLMVKRVRGTPVAGSPADDYATKTSHDAGIVAEAAECPQGWLHCSASHCEDDDNAERQAEKSNEVSVLLQNAVIHKAPPLERGHRGHSGPSMSARKSIR